MNEISARSRSFVLAIVGLLSLARVLNVDAAKLRAPGVPVDWTHRHVVFSRSRNPEQTSQLLRDPRYAQQWARRGLAPYFADRASSTLASSSAPSFVVGHGLISPHDWSESLGPGGTVGAGNFPAKYSFGGSVANCGNAISPDFVVFTTSLIGSASQASIVAYDNLYSGCGGIAPSVYWAYNTGGQILTSPAISLDGSQVAFVQTSGGEGMLVLLKWEASTTASVSAPSTLSAVPNVAYRTCQAPCMTVLPLLDSAGNPADDQTSSAFPDYSGDIIWVGDSGGWLHKITGVFRGVPAEVTTAGFPKQVNAGNPTTLSSPVYDFSSGNVFVGDFGGYLYLVHSGTGAVTASARLDYGVGIVAGPIVDSTASIVYAFASNDGRTNCTGGSACSAVYALSSSFTAGAPGAKALVGNSSTTSNVLYEGDFDSTYQNSSNATGSLYVCGNTGGAPTLYKVPINGGVMGTPVEGPRLSNGTTGCSPVTDVANPNVAGGGAEWIFVGLQDQGVGESCAAGGCVYNFKDQPWQPLTAYHVGQQVLDTNFQIQVVSVAGTSETVAPGWTTTAGISTADGSVRWWNQGRQRASHPAWVPNHTYSVGSVILDTNQDVQIVIRGGASQSGPHPNWNAAIGALTADNTVRWRNVGAIATANLRANGGVSGIILDNTVGSSTIPGASQVYFSTLGNEVCGSGGVGGCAVQASQVGLQ